MFHVCAASSLHHRRSNRFMHMADTDPEVVVVDEFSENETVEVSSDSSVDSNDLFMIDDVDEPMVQVDQCDELVMYWRRGVPLILIKIFALLHFAVQAANML